MENLRGKFEAKLKAGHRYVLRRCGFCNYPCNFFSKNDTLYYDAGCDCSSVAARPDPEEYKWYSLDFYFQPEHGHLAKFEKWVNEV